MNGRLMKNTMHSPWRKYTAIITVVLFLFLVLAIDFTHRHQQFDANSAAMRSGQTAPTGSPSGTQQTLTCLACVYSLNSAALQLTPVALQFDKQFQLTAIRAASYRLIPTLRPYALRAPPATSV